MIVCIYMYDITLQTIGNFPNTNISVLSINASMNWLTVPGTLDAYPLSSSGNGSVYFYKYVHSFM